ncbi:MAG: hypothetical protein NW205_08700 [Hyphomicrobiaceae bacterium]|nr:hypothetical protein [Hyphomicrobiaceae bacterium]
MNEPGSRSRTRTIILALGALIALNEPLLGLFTAPPAPASFGLPPLYLYVFAVWAAVILLQAAIVASADAAPRPPEIEPPEER